MHPIKQVSGDEQCLVRVEVVKSAQYCSDEYVSNGEEKLIICVHEKRRKKKKSIVRRMEEW